MPETYRDRLEYNGIVMRGVRTERFEQRLRYNTGDTDVLFSVFRLTVSALLHNDFRANEQAPFYHPINTNVNIPGGVPVVGQEPPVNRQYLNPTQKLEDALAQLSVPGGLLRYYTGNQLLLNVGGVEARRQYRQGSGGRTDYPFATDMNTGPRPEADVSEFVGGNVFRVRFSVEVAIVIGCDWDPPPGPRRSQTIQEKIEHVAPSDSFWDALEEDWVLNHQWSYTEQKDRDLYSKKRLRGVLRVRSADDWAHYMRFVVVPPLQDGYQRQSQEFTQTEDRLSLQYTILDQERFAAPPWPAVEWNAVHRERAHPFLTGTSGGMRVMQVADLRIQLTGGPGTRKTDLIKTAYDIIDQRLGFEVRRQFDENDERVGSPGKGQRNAIVQHVMLTDVLHSNQIELAIEVAYDEADSKTLYNASLRSMGERLQPSDETSIGGNSNLKGYFSGRWPQPGLYDSREPVGIFANYIQHPCSDIHGITEPVQITTLAGNDWTARDFNIPQTSEDGTHAFREVPGAGAYVFPWHNRNSFHQNAPAEIFEALEISEFDADEPNEYSSQNDNFPFQDVQVDTQYETQEHVMALPLAKPKQSGDPAQQGTAQVYIDYAPRTDRRIVVLDIMRRGDHSLVPQINDGQFDPNGIKERLIERKILFEIPELGPDGRTYHYRTRAKFVYELEKGIPDNGKRRVASSPADRGFSRGTNGQEFDHQEYDSTLFYESTERQPGLGSGQQ